MRRETDEVVRGFLALNALLREELRDVRRLFEARTSETKYNPNWRLQPRAPIGTREGGRWIDAGGKDGGPKGGGSNRPNRGNGTGTQPGHNRPPLDSLQEIFRVPPNAPASAIFVPIDHFFGLSAPGRAAAEQALRNRADYFIQEIRSIDPTFPIPSVAEPGGFPNSIQGMNNYVLQLQTARAVAIYRTRGEIAPLQVATLQMMQRRVDEAYNEGRRLQREGRLSGSLSDPQALGNYVDAQVRVASRNHFSSARLDWTRDPNVRVQGREYDSSGTDLTYRIPDVRIGRVAFDATITRKTPGLAQIRGYFAADFAPIAVLVVRPTELGGCYYITPPVLRTPRG